MRCGTCPEFCDLCHAYWRERALYFEAKAIEAAKVCRKRTAEREEARDKVRQLEESVRWLDCEASRLQEAGLTSCYERDEARQVAHELCFPPKGRTQAVLREICERYPWICQDSEPW
jgi:hypothetical protein